MIDDKCNKCKFAIREMCIVVDCDMARVDVFLNIAFHHDSGITAESGCPYFKQREYPQIQITTEIRRDVKRFCPKDKKKYKAHDLPCHTCQWECRTRQTRFVDERKQSPEYLKHVLEEATNGRN